MFQTMNYKVLLFLSFFVSLVSVSLASNTKQDRPTDCPAPKSPQDILRCAQEQHPRVQQAKLDFNQSQSLTDKAGQFVNPELSIESASITVEGEKKKENKAALLIPIELGGKRSARKQEAEAQVKKIQTGLLEAQAEVTIETVLKLHRLRQLEKEKTILQVAVDNFTSVVNQQKSRPSLSPEQRVSLATFKMALSEAKIREAELFEEEKNLEKYFLVSTGHSLNVIRPYMPKSPQSWPAISSVQQENSLFPEVLHTRAELDLALAEYESARAETWPDLKIGPMIQDEEEGTNRRSIFGFQLSMGLPIFNLNSGGRSYSKLGVAKAKRAVELTQMNSHIARDEQVKLYERSVQILKNSPAIEDLEKEQKQYRDYTNRGLVSAALIIEFHRQVEELTRSRYKQEIKALESLWRVHNFDGKILTETL